MTPESIDTAFSQVLTVGGPFATTSQYESRPRGSNHDGFSLIQRNHVSMASRAAFSYKRRLAAGSVAGSLGGTNFSNLYP